MDHALKFYINGEWVDPVVPATPATLLDVINPATEQAFAQIAMGSAADVDKAVAAAKAAFVTFSATSKEERIALLNRILKVFMRRADEIGAAISQEMGAPLAMAKSDQTGSGIAHLMETIKAAESFDYDYMQGTTRIEHEPIGVVAMITPWNWPINQITAKVAPAIATGCTMVLKPSEIAPMSAILFAEIMDEAGVPKGVFNLVHGDGPVVGTALSGHKDVDMVSFTGSTRAGVSVAQNAAPTVKRVHQELGGKSPNIILRSADLDKAVRSGVARCFGNSGQSCNAPTRMFVPQELMDKAITIARDAAENYRTGNPNSDDTNLGPVVSQLQFDKIQDLIQSGIDEGAELVTGGTGRPDDLKSGYYVRPTIFGRVGHTMRVSAEEIFGPVLSMIGYDTLDDAVEMANDTVYGLASYIQGDLAEARALSKRLRTGNVIVNDAGWDGAAPFGGYKQSGNGREYGVFGLREFVEIKGVIGYEK
ncbi:aldehyde dehydrogenase family protein [Pseudochrobactrum sp. MP213Fo]|uniref:aldehyde dehydrogenase family protein n=1 Tax=Pseudochrobactrum sp. MP213Fo TaxID=3022250 RepID=UPI003BA2E3EA